MIFPNNIQEYDSFSVGQRIRWAREKKGYKSIQMAMQLNISKTHYSRIECGRSICPTETLHMIAQYLEVSADYLLFGREEDKNLAHIIQLIQNKNPNEIDKMIRVLEIMAS